MEYLADLTGLGVSAVCVILFYKLASVQIRANTQALREMTSVISELKTVIRENK